MQTQNDFETKLLNIDVSDSKIFRISSNYSILLPYNKFALKYFDKFNYTYLKSGKKVQIK